MTTKTQREIADAVREAQFEGRMDNFEVKLDELTSLVKGIAAEIKTTQVVQFDVAQLKLWQAQMTNAQISKERFETLEKIVYRILWGFGSFVIAAIAYATFGQNIKL